jgi:U32 family peptidase
VTMLDKGAATPPRRAMAAEPVLSTLLGPITAERDRQAREGESGPGSSALTVLCRQTAQIEAAVALGIGTIYADYQDIKEYAGAVSAARLGGAAIYLATPRIEKPSEANLFRYMAKLGADGILVRNAGGLYFCAERGIPFVADFSLNAANPLAVELFKNRGAARVTASYDLNSSQLFDLLDAVPADWLEIVIHQQIPMFHMEHCVYCAFLSPGTDKTNCGRPCDHHDVKLRDRVGMDHPQHAL